MNYRKTPERPVKPDEKRRTFTDADGTFWDVRELRNPDYDRRGGSSLIFESVNAIRRVRNFPPNWYEWDDEQLAALSHRT